MRYRSHPWQGRQVAVRGVRTRNGLKVLSCTLDDGCRFPVLEIPEWMFDAVVCDRLERAEAARVNAGALHGLRSLLDSIKRKAKEVMLEDRHHARVERGADARRSKSSQFELFRKVRRRPEVPSETQRKMIRLLAQLLREHMARKGRLDANHE